MINGKNVLAIIPARGGSKGLPGKNIKELCGKPLMAWSIEQSLDSKYVDYVIVSTDDNDIANIAKEYGANVPFLRPPELAQDETSTIDSIAHVIDQLQKIGKYFDYVALIEPTSPLRETSDIDLAIEQLISSDADAIVGICKTEDQNPAFLVNLEKSGKICGFINKDMRVIRRQDISDVYFFEGSIYISKTDVLLRKKTFYHENTLGYIVPKYKSLEVDDIYDFIMIEAIMKYIKNN